MKYFLNLSYKGTDYHGWQSQPNGITIQEVLNDRLSKKLKTEIKCVGCGRTDAGVHASSYYLHFYYDGIIPEGFIKQMNFYLPPDIALNHLYTAPDDANARFSAYSRTYIYKIHQHKNPFLKGLSNYIFQPLDLDLIKEATLILLTAQDFTTFSKHSKEQKHHLCNIHSAEWTVEGNELWFTISANRFLRGMVRAITGSLLAVGRKKMSVEDFKLALELKDRTKCAALAQPHGLYLADVKYPAGLLTLIE